jgi:hypothetical protein
VALSTLMQPLGLRADVAYNRFSFSDRAGVTTGDTGNESVGSATLNATYRLPMTNAPISPYIITGLGAYRTECSLDAGCDASTRFGWNAGLGSRLYILGLRSFIEARYNRTSRSGHVVHYVPVTLGLLL